jgi:hypothetical protein
MDAYKAKILNNIVEKWFHCTWKVWCKHYISNPNRKEKNNKWYLVSKIAHQTSTNTWNLQVFHMLPYIISYPHHEENSNHLLAGN